MRQDNRPANFVHITLCCKSMMTLVPVTPSDTTSTSVDKDEVGPPMLTYTTPDHGRFCPKAINLFYTCVRIPVSKATKTFCSRSLMSLMSLISSVNKVFKNLAKNILLVNDPDN